MLPDPRKSRKAGPNGHAESMSAAAAGRRRGLRRTGADSAPSPSGAEPSELTEFLGAKLAVLRRWWRLVAISIAACLALAVVYLLVARRLYESEAQVLVLEHGNRPLSVSKEAAQDHSRMEDYLPTQMAILSSPRVVGHAIEAAGLDNLPSLKAATAGGASPLGTAVKKYLSVTRPDRNAMIVKVAYRAWSPAEANLMMGALLGSYDSFLEEHYQTNNSKVVTLLSKARDELNVDLADAEKKHLEMLGKNPLLGMVGEDSSRSLFARRVERWDDESNDLKLKAARLRSQLAVAKKLDEGGSGLLSMAYALNQLGGESGAGLLSGVSGMSGGVTSDYIRQLSSQQQEMADQHGPDFAKVREIQGQITRVVEQSRDSRRRIEKSEVSDLINSIEESLKSIEARREEFAGEFDREMAEVKSFAAEHAAEASLRDRVHRQRELFHTVIEQLKQAELGGDFSSISVHVTEPPNASKSPAHPRLARTMLIALLAGCLVGGAAALVADVLDSRVHSHAELLQVAGYRVVGRIPKIGTELAGRAGNVGLVSLHHPTSPEAEAYRTTRTCVEYLRRHHEARVILVTSPVSGDGKSVTASNVAISLAQAGRRVLLVDADLRRPTIHRSHGLRSDLGLSTVLMGIRPAADAVQRSAVENLDVMTCGPRVPSPAELLMSPRFKEMVDEMRERFDYVIIDSSPLNIVTDAAVVGTVVDGILLVVRQSSSLRDDIEQAVDLLGTIGTPVLGTVINEVSRRAVGYSYGPGAEDEARPGAVERNGHPVAAGVPGAPDA